jgi:hypothetical protein
MHNCKTTRDLMTELLSDETSAPTQELLIELRDCRECRNEFASLKDTLRLTTEVIESVAPPEEYWSDYHQTLKEKLLASHAPVVTIHQPSWLTQMFRTSVRVPVPVGLAAVLLLGVSLFFTARATAPKQTETSVVRERVEVPVTRVEERIVTRIVYRDRYRTLISRKENQTDDQSPLARSEKKEAIPAMLVGFKPLDEIKLTVIKGGTGNDK